MRDRRGYRRVLNVVLALSVVATGLLIAAVWSVLAHGETPLFYWSAGAAALTIPINLGVLLVYEKSSGR